LLCPLQLRQQAVCLGTDYSQQGDLTDAQLFTIVLKHTARFAHALVLLCYICVILCKGVSAARFRACLLWLWTVCPSVVLTYWSSLRPSLVLLESLFYFKCLGLWLLRCRINPQLWRYCRLSGARAVLGPV
jgi:hypothetical protein